MRYNWKKTLEEAGYEVKFKVIFFLLLLMFAVYTADKSYVIAKAGAQYGIPQLLGDGGGGLVFSVLCLITAIVSLAYFRVTLVLLLISGILIILVGVTYQDNGTLYWSIIPLLFAIAYFMVQRVWRKETPRDTNHHTSHLS
jgi:hypothetical protein